MTTNIYTESNGIWLGEQSVHGPIPEARVREAESALGLQFPPTYRNFLLHMGAIDEIAGLFDLEPVENAWRWRDVVEFNRLMRTDLHGIEHDRHLISVSDTGGDAWYCLDFTRTARGGEFPVVLHGPEHDPPGIIASDFFEFFKSIYGSA